MNKVVEILCRRDGISVEEAERMVEGVREQIAEVNFMPEEVEGIIASNLGLEMDYIFDILML